MTHSITIDFPSYEVMKTFVGSFEGIEHFFDYQQDDEGNQLWDLEETWGKSRFSIKGSEVCDANPLQMFLYFYNGSTEGYDLEKDHDGKIKITRKGIINPRGQS